MTNFESLTPPSEGHPIRIESDKFVVPDDPLIPFIRGDGIGVDITPAMLHVVNAAVAKASGGKRRIVWFEIYAGEGALKKYSDILPQDTLKAIREYVVSIKGPLTTPVGGGFRSLNVSLRQMLDLYACVRPVRYFHGVPSPVSRPELMNVVIFRENMEDVYAGIEWQSGGSDAKKVITMLNDNMGTKIRDDSGIGIKPISPYGSKRLIRKAIRYAIAHERTSVTLVHKGNIMKFTEGAFRDWGYELARQEFAGQTITEHDVGEKFDGKAPEGKIVIKDRIADSMFQQVLTRPSEYDVLATPNLNGDYLSDACAAQVGGLGMAPGGNMSDHVALFEATHGTAPRYAGKDQVNPGSIILSACMMLEYIGWNDAAQMIYHGIERAIQKKTVTYDLARLMEGNVKPARCSEFAQAIVDNLGSL